MKVVCLLGSPRTKGNSAIVAGTFIDALKPCGAEVTTYVLNKLNYRGCQACYACKTTHDRCVLKDDLGEVLEAVRAADVLVLATPVYYGDIPGQMKSFIDRTFSFLVPDYITNPSPSRLAPGKTLVFIITQGHPDEKMFSDVFPRYESFLKWYGYSDIHLIRACGVQKEGDVAHREDIMALAEGIARAVAARS